MLFLQKKTILLCVILWLLAIPLFPLTAATLFDNPPSLFYGPGHYLEGQPIQPGANSFGYDYQARTFNGSLFNAYAGSMNFPPYMGNEAAYLIQNPGASGHWAWYWHDTNLEMQWNDAFLSNQDQDNDQELDIHYNLPSYIDSGAELHVHISGSDPVLGPTTVNLRINAALSTAVKSNNNWFSQSGTPVGPALWLEFAETQRVSTPAQYSYNQIIPSPVNPSYGSRFKLESLPTQPGRHERLAWFEGTDRSTVIHIPPGYDPQDSHPLILGLHGGAGNPFVLENVNQKMISYAASEGAILVFAEGVPARRNYDRKWNSWDKNNIHDDVEFLASMIDEFASQLAVNPDQVYMYGFSNGAAMTQRMAADRPEKINAAASACHTSAYSESGAYYSIPDPVPPHVPILIIRGGSDVKITPDGTVGKSGKIADTPQQQVDFWLGSNLCDLNAVVYGNLSPVIDSQNDTSFEKYESGCSPADAVVWLVFDPTLKHNWPRTVTGLNGDRLVIEFFFGSNDSDLDGIVDLEDSCPDDPNPLQLDPDQDGVGTSCDNCPAIWNPRQIDTDSDGQGNFCDCDLDNNGTVDLADLQLFSSAWLSNPLLANWNPNADFNCNTRVNLADWSIFASYWLGN